MFGPSFSIGTYFGIPVKLHWTFLLLLAWAGAAQFMVGGSTGAIVSGVIFIGSIFVCVILHELGHCLAARHFGISTRDITLSPLGGLAALEESPRNWKEELWIALAGPAVNLVICLLILPYLIFNPMALTQLLQATNSLDAFLARLFLGNFMLLAFNLLPAFPMDGGRVLRAVLESGTDRVKATRIAARIGQGFAILFALGGTLISFFLILIGLFVFLAAEAEYRMVLSRSRLRGLRVRDVMRTRFEGVSGWDSMREVLLKTVRGGQIQFPVYRDGVVVAMLDRASLHRAADRKDYSALVTDYSIADFAMTGPEESLSDVQDLMAKTRQSVLPVFDHEGLVGLIDDESIATAHRFPVRELEVVHDPPFRFAEAETTPR